MYGGRFKADYVRLSFITVTSEKGLPHCRADTLKASSMPPIRRNKARHCPKEIGEDLATFLLGGKAHEPSSCCNWWVASSEEPSHQKGLFCVGPVAKTGQILNAFDTLPEDKKAQYRLALLASLRWLWKGSKHMKDCNKHPTSMVAQLLGRANVELQGVAEKAPSTTGIKEALEKMKEAGPGLPCVIESLLADVDSEVQKQMSTARSTAVLAQHAEQLTEHERRVNLTAKLIAQSEAFEHLERRLQSHDGEGRESQTNAMGMGLRPSVLVLTDNESCVLPAEHCEERMTDIERRLQSLEQEGREPQMNAMRLVHFVFALLANIGKMLAYACGYACGLFL